MYTENNFISRKVNSTVHSLGENPARITQRKSCTASSNSQSTNRPTDDKSR